MTSFEFLGVTLMTVGGIIGVAALFNKRELDRLERLVARYRAEGKL
ncbi:MAG: hypothetical protein WDM92_12050 [Caulobacteraceae bacterium]